MLSDVRVRTQALSWPGRNLGDSRRGIRSFRSCCCLFKGGGGCETNGQWYLQVHRGLWTNALCHTAGMGQAVEGQKKKETIGDQEGPGSMTLNVLTDPQSSINTVQQDGPDSRGIRQRPGQCGTDRQNDMRLWAKTRVGVVREDLDGVCKGHNDRARWA